MSSFVNTDALDAHRVASLTVGHVQKNGRMTPGNGVR
jgi:hypothetical protein